MFSLETRCAVFRRLKGYAPTGSQRAKSIEIDHIHAVTEELRTLKRARKPFSLTTTDIDGTVVIHTAILSQITSNIAQISFNRLLLLNSFSLQSVFC